MTAIDGFDVEAFVTATLAEDLGPGGDVTSQAVIPAEARFAAVMDTRDAITVAARAAGQGSGAVPGRTRPVS